ncbi:tyrosine-type recombinase/integrase [Bacillus sp. E(2018)]|uniref:tyrosine-type recombinase/integrase n=1 Tax=Bacillus sp. E(2018) TaxID=2502239 RepID=UPI0010F5E2AC|nr:tyrosine-type recombinase/integrase [Bacillus sp. E(2018)]
MNNLEILKDRSKSEELTELIHNLENKNFLDEDRNLNLREASERDFIEMFFFARVFVKGKEFSHHTKRAYRADAKTLLDYLAENELSFSDIGYPEVKAYNEYISEKYAAKTAIRKLEFFRRLLDFGYDTKYYSAPLSRWIHKPAVKRGHYLNENNKNRVQLRELNQEDAERLIEFFPRVVRTKYKQKHLQQRNLLLGYLLYTTGLRASEIVNLNKGSFYYRRGELWVDVIGKGGKHREVPVREETEKELLHYLEMWEGNTVIDSGDETPLFYSLYNKEETRQRITYNHLYKIVKEAVRLAGANDKISPHWFRHTFVTTMLENEVPLVDVKEWVGHSDISTTNLYLERVNKGKSYQRLKKVQLFENNR